MPYTNQPRLFAVYFEDRTIMAVRDWGRPVIGEGPFDHCIVWRRSDGTVQGRFAEWHVDADAARRSILDRWAEEDRMQADFVARRAAAERTQTT